MWNNNNKKSSMKNKTMCPTKEKWQHENKLIVWKKTMKNKHMKIFESCKKMPYVKKKSEKC